MARARGAYSQLIAWLKIALPMIALALLSTLFMLSRPEAPAENLPIAAQLNGTATISPGVNAPYYAGATARGDLLTLTAQSARPTGVGMIWADTVEATMQMTDGSRVTVTAPVARVRDTERRVRLEDGVVLKSSEGFQLETQVLVAALDQIDAETETPVTGQGPGFTLQAGLMQLSSDGSQDGLRLHFTQGVHLVYQRSEDQ